MLSAGANARALASAHFLALLLNSKQRPFAAFRGDIRPARRRRAKPFEAGMTRVDLMQISPAHSSSVAKYMRRRRIYERSFTDYVARGGK
jgi:hypothetical protein